MIRILDLLSSAFAITSIVALILVSAGITFLTLKKKKLNISSKFFIITFIILVSAGWVYLRIENNLGLSDNFGEIKVIDNKICFTEIDVFKNKYGVFYNYRLFVVDEKTGKLLDRTYIGVDAQIIDYLNNMIILSEKNKYIVYNLKTLEIDKTIDEKYLAQKFAEFNIGIEKLKLVNSYLIITAKNGKSYTYSIFDDKIIDTEYPYDLLLNGYYSVSDNSISYTTNNIPETIFSFGTERPDDLIAYIVENKKNIKSKDIFLAGKFIDLYEQKGIIIVQSFETTDKEKFTLTALDFDLNTLWTKKYEDFEPFDKFSKNLYQIKITHSDDYFILAIGGFLIKIDALKGNIIWKKRF